MKTRRYIFFRFTEGFLPNRFVSNFASLQSASFLLDITKRLPSFLSVELWIFLFVCHVWLSTSQSVYASLRQLFSSWVPPDSFHLAGGGFLKGVRLSFSRRQKKYIFWKFRQSNFPPPPNSDDHDSVCPLLNLPICPRTLKLFPGAHKNIFVSRCQDLETQTDLDSRILNFDHLFRVCPV